jgi:hypothetical protein
MYRDGGSGDSGTLTHELKLKNWVTIVPRIVTVSVKCPEVSPKCHSYCHQSVTYMNKAK